MIRISSTAFTAPIFALALASILPSQAQADCSNANRDALDNYVDDGLVHTIICDPTVDLIGDPNPGIANTVVGDAADDTIFIGFGGNAFNVLDNVSGQIGKDTIIYSRWQYCS